MSPAIYVITYHKFNHEGRLPLDKRFLQSDKNFIYYLIDETLPQPLHGKKVLFEKEIDPLLHKAGSKYFGEWSFLLAEAKHQFCTYPLFMISSRFYDKNFWLYRDLTHEWTTLFSHFESYKWGFLPSYDRPLRWLSNEWQHRIGKKKIFFPFTAKTFELTSSIYNLRIPEDYPYTSDLFCNYIGFKTRSSLLEYVNFYMPVINKLFDETYTPKAPLDEYVINTNAFRNEKPFTFYLEYFSHLFFAAKKEKFFALHYDGYYEIEEGETKKRKLISFPLNVQTRLKHFLSWQKRRLKMRS